MAEYEALGALPIPRKVAELTPEAKLFKAYKVKWKHTETSSVVKLAFCPTTPHRLAVVHGTKVSFWSPGTDGTGENDSNLSKFKDFTQCVAWRHDGKLLLAGEASGTCAVVETEHMKVLRRLRGHGDAVTCASFSLADKTRAVTGGRDGRLRVWDVATNDLLQTVDAHSDCMKAIASGVGGPDSFISAGYDGLIKRWDLRAADGGGAGGGACVVTADHGAAVEDGAVFPGGAMYCSAGGPVVKIWDLASGGRLLQSLPEAHSKTVTSVSLGQDASLMLTASFDGLAKVFRVADLEHLWTYRLDGPITCAAWRPDGKALALGMDSGQWHMRQGKEEIAKNVSQEESTKRSWVRTLVDPKGRDVQPGPDDEIVVSSRPLKRKKEKGVDVYLRKFEYRKAIDFVVNGADPVQGWSVIDELLQRGSLAAAMSEQGEEFCLNMIRWLLKNYTNGETLKSRLFEECVHTLLDHNRCLQPPCTAALTDAVGMLERRVAQELAIQEVVFETHGILKTIMTI